MSGQTIWLLKKALNLFLFFIEKALNFLQILYICRHVQLNILFVYDREAGQKKNSGLKLEVGGYTIIHKPETI